MTNEQEATATARLPFGGTGENAAVVDNSAASDDPFETIGRNAGWSQDEDTYFYRTGSNGVRERAGFATTWQDLCIGQNLLDGDSEVVNQIEETAETQVLETQDHIIAEAPSLGSVETEDEPAENTDVDLTPLAEPYEPKPQAGPTDEASSPEPAQLAQENVGLAETEERVEREGIALPDANTAEAVLAASDAEDDASFNVAETTGTTDTEDNTRPEHDGSTDELVGDDAPVSEAGQEAQEIPVEQVAESNLTPAEEASQATDYRHETEIKVEGGEEAKPQPEAPVVSQEDAARAAEKQSVLSQVKTVLDTYKITTEEVVAFLGGLPEHKRQTAKPKPKYRDPATGTTWTGRGKEPLWIRGKDRSLFLITD